MINLDEFKSLTRYLVIESENLSNDKKLSLVKFIEEANEDHLSVILSDEDYIGLSKGELNLINEVSVHGGFGQVLIKLSRGEVGVGAAIAATALIWFASRWFKRALDKYHKACKHFKTGTPQYKECWQGAKKKAIIGQISLLQKSKAKCKRTKNPEKCGHKIDMKIQELKNKLS